ncbi:MAG: DnaJ domain-containing protein [Alphaproteobacteria bacterium]|nr:DnaJ domain-containing protein [Alphaproteobacteria bacterium]
MDRKLAARVEIDTLHGLLDELDYYRLLQVASDVSADEVGPAFRRESRRLHPDRYSALGDKDLSDKANAIYRLIREAYATLSDPEKRALYDAELRGGQARLSAAADKEAEKQRAAAADPAEAATNPKSEKYWKMGLKDFKEGNFSGAVMNIQFALTYEPGNATFKEYLDRAKQGAEEQKKKNYNPYKLRIV